jgi:hypothetical protein
MDTTQPATAAGDGSPQIFNARDRITVATPTYDFTLTEYYHQSLRECMQAPLARFRSEDGAVAMDSVLAGRLNMPNDSHIDRARNVIANLWYRENKTDWLLWIDADIEFGPADIARIWVHGMRGTRFVCGLYAVKCLVPTFVANKMPGAVADPETGLIEIMHGGTGFMLLHRSVFTELQAHPDVKRYKCSANTPWAGEVFHSYFGSGVSGPADEKDGLQDWLSEDWMICQRWRDLGHKVYADQTIKLRHFGRMLFPPDVPDLVAAVQALRRAKHPGLPAVL